jgi:hypothetical protein
MDAQDGEAWQSSRQKKAACSPRSAAEQGVGWRLVMGDCLGRHQETEKLCSHPHSPTPRVLHYHHPCPPLQKPAPTALPPPPCNQTKRDASGPTLMLTPLTTMRPRVGTTFSTSAIVPLSLPAMTCSRTAATASVPTCSQHQRRHTPVTNLLFRWVYPRQVAMTKFHLAVSALLHSTTLPAVEGLEDAVHPTQLCLSAAQCCCMLGVGTAISGGLDCCCCCCRW